MTIDLGKKEQNPQAHTSQGEEKPSQPIEISPNEDYLIHLFVSQPLHNDKPKSRYGRTVKLGETTAALAGPDRQDHRNGQTKRSKCGVTAYNAMAQKKKK